MSLNRYIAILLVLISQFALSDPLYVVGTIETFDNSDFSVINNSGYNTLELKVPVLGASANTLVFDIDASVSGNGYYDLNYECLNPINVGGGVIMLVPGFPPCAFETVNPSDVFLFEVEMTSYCSDFYVGSDNEDRNNYLPYSEVTRIRSEAEADIQQGNSFWLLSPSNYYDTDRSLNLSINNVVATNGNCSELTVIVKGYRTYIDDIELNVLIAEPF